jgi:hypothetical protein
VSVPVTRGTRRRPVFDGAFNIVGLEAFADGALGQRGQLGVGCKAQCDGLLHVDPRIQCLAGQEIVAQILFDTDHAILCPESKNAAVERGQQRTPTQDENQRRAV